MIFKVQQHYQPKLAKFLLAECTLINAEVDTSVIVNSCSRHDDLIISVSLLVFHSVSFFIIIVFNLAD